MSHYFDDMFQRSIELGPPHSPKMHRIRRSSTARSIGARSDFEASVNGGDEYGDDDDDDARSDGTAGAANGRPKDKEKSEADEHMHRYVSDQLNRYKDDIRSDRFGRADEFEPHADSPKPL